MLWADENHKIENGDSTTPPPRDHGGRSENHTIQLQATTTKQMIKKSVPLLGTVIALVLFSIPGLVMRRPLLPLTAEKNLKNPTTTRSSSGSSIHSAAPPTAITVVRPRDLHLVFLGDSVTRFQYLSLAYYLMTGGTSFYRDDVEVGNYTAATSRSILKPRGNGDGTSTQSWQEYYHYSNQRLQPYEQCDCFRIPGRTCENRYYKDPQHNNSLTYILKYGGLGAHGHWETPISAASTQQPVNNTQWSWGNYDWSQVIRYHISQLDPKPTHVVFNAGHHDHDLMSPAVQGGIQQALKDTNIIGIYKTTTRSRTASRTDHHGPGRDDAQLCGNVFSRCINVDWTGDLLGDDFYYDNLHMRGFANEILNVQLLEFLAQDWKRRRSDGEMTPLVSQIDDLSEWLQERDIMSPFPLSIMSSTNSTFS